VGQLGVVSGTALDVVLARRLQLGDPDGELRRAIQHFPEPAVAERILQTYFIEGGKAPDAAFRSKPMFSASPKRRNDELAVLAGFVEVFLAKEGHDGVVASTSSRRSSRPRPRPCTGRCSPVSTTCWWAQASRATSPG